MIKSRNKTVEVEVTESLACDNCEAAIPLVFPDADRIHQQGLHALEVHFDGGYGMYIDPIGEPAEQFRMLWCNSCADKLTEAFPSIAKRIKP